MEKLFNTISVISGFIGGVALRLFGGFDTALWALLVMMVLDYVSGVIKAINQKRLSSEIGFKGILKKITVFLVIAAANSVQKLTGDSCAIRETVIVFYIANEAISLLENVASVSTKIPIKLKDVLLQLRGDTNE